VLIKAHLGTLTLHDILAQHNEHRLAVARLILLAICPFTHWNNIATLLVGWMLVCATSLLIWWLVRMTQPPGRRALLWFLCNLLIFTPAQNENWLWGICVENFSPTLFVMATLAVAFSGIPNWIRITLCVLLAIAATLSSGNGVTAWPLAAFPIFMWRGFQDKPGPAKWSLLVWLAVAVAVLVAYRYGYQEPPHNGHPYVRTLGAVSIYMLAFLGNAFAHLGGWDNPSIGIAIGTFMVLILLVACAFIVRAWHDGPSSQFHAGLPWLMIAGYALASALIAALFRAQFGPMQAVTSRYVSYSIYLPVALINLVPIMAGDLKQIGTSLFLRIAKYLPPALAIVLMVLQACTLPRAFRDCENRRIQFRMGRGALLLLDVVTNNPEILRLGIPEPQQLHYTTKKLSEMGYIQPPIITLGNAQLLMSDNPRDEVPNPAGALDGVQKSPGGALYVRGWAAIGPRGEPAESVFLTYGNERGEPIIFGAAFTGFRRDDIEQTAKTPVSPWCGWEARLDIHRIPSNIKSTPIVAWILNVDTGKAAPLGGYVMIQK
jgi:hypothetical protein